MTPGRFASFNFSEETEACAYLERQLYPYFKLVPEVWCRHLVTNQPLRIDYVARPLADAECALRGFSHAVDFPFDWFGIEVKRTIVDGSLYNDAIKQGIDYTHCKIDDPRANSFNGQRIERVYLFPGMPDSETEGHDKLTSRAATHAYHADRIAGKFHVGVIRIANPTRYRPTNAVYFFCSADRQWCSVHGPRAGPHNTRQRLGSGVARREPATTAPP